MQARAVILALTVAIVASGQAWAENVLRWSTPAEQTFDPHGATGYVPIQSIIQVYEGLIRRTAGMHIDFEPGLAVSWRLVEPTAWEFELRPGVTFHNGAPFTAEDVAFSIERAKGQRGGYYKQRVLGITEVEILSSHRVLLRTAEPDPLLPARIMLFPIMSKTWTEAAGVIEPQALDRNYLFDHASGTGPFKLVSATLDGTVVLARNPIGGASRNSLTTSTGSSILGSATSARVPRRCCAASRIWRSIPLSSCTSKSKSHQGPSW